MIYTALLVPCGLAPYGFGLTGALYGAVAATTGALMLLLAWRVWAAGEDPAERAAKQLFAFSILYLFLLFAVLLVARGGAL